MLGSLLVLLLILGAVIVVILMTTIVQVEQYEAGVALRLGKFHSMLNPGWNFVIPLITQVFKVDLRIQVLDVPRQEVITKDNSPTMVDAVVYYRVADANKAVLAVANYRAAIVNMAQTTLRGVVGDMELDEIFSSRDKINSILREKLDVETDPWGVKVDNVEIREVDPSPNVKAAMEEQTSAERERRAAILKADGEKRSSILNAEGDKQSRILNAEGDKQSRILAAEGIRQAKVLTAQGQRSQTILEKQGEAQGLRITAMGASALDSKALTVLSLESLKEIGAGASTKFVIPFELTKLFEGAADYVGYSRKAPDRQLSEVKDIENALGKSEDILGTIPTAAEMQAELDAIKEDSEEALKEIKEDGIKDKMSSTEPPKELKTPKT
ncbi:MAG: membrane protease subunit, stomatin/prohibitin [Methanobacteriota archaeon]|jgi:regulator of protease activity HflC (stomatin/prohibitin superfamily)|nr:MAG: membrane protease subunit, stomatin/prohibitin [Euryarchaeota archaeon]